MPLKRAFSQVRAQLASPLRLSAVLALSGTLVSTVAQLLVPAILLRAWNDYGYAVVLAVQGLTAYVSVADLGLQATLLHRLSILTARGELDEARSVARAGLIALVWLSSLAAAAVIIFALATFGLLWRPIAESAGAGGFTMVVAISAMAISTATAVSLGGWSTAVEYARGRYVLVQLAPLVRTIGTLAALFLAASWHSDPARGLIGSATFGIALDVARFTASHRFLRGPSPARLRVRSLLWQSRGGPVYAFGLATNNGLIPAVLGVTAPLIASAAVPGRTVSNGARVVANTVGNAIWVPLAARLEALRGDPEARALLSHRTATLLAVIQCGSLGLVLLIAPWVVPLWLPSKSNQIMASLPVFLIEQAFLICAVPAQIKLMAAGRLLAVGTVSIAGGVFILVMTMILVPKWGVQGYALAVALSAGVVVAPALLWLERDQWRRDGLSWSPWSRLLLTGGALLAVVTALLNPVIASGMALALIALCGVSLYGDRRLLRSRKL